MLNLEYTAQLTSSWAPTQWLKLVLASQNGEWLCLFLLIFLRIWFPLYLWKRNSLLLARHWRKNHSGVVYCALQTRFLCSFSGFTQNLQEACSPQNIIKRIGNLFLTSVFCIYGKHRQWGQRKINIWWYVSLHIPSSCWKWDQHIGAKGDNILTVCHKSSDFL